VKVKVMVEVKGARITKRVKASNHSKMPVKPAKDALSPKIIEFYRSPGTQEQIPVALGFLYKLAREWAEWSLLDDSLRIKDFFLERNIPIDTMYNWLEKYPFLKEVHNTVMERIASRRDRGAIMRKYDGNYIDKTLPMYDLEYRKFLEWRASIADKNKESSGTLVVQMWTAPNSDLVPTKKKDGPIDV